MDSKDRVQTHSIRDFEDIDFTEYFLCEDPNYGEEIKENVQKKIIHHEQSESPSSFNSPNILNNSDASTTNFLKNLIKLLRSWVKTQSMIQQMPEKGKFLWKLFMKEKKHSKQLFHLLFGGQNQDHNTFLKLCQDFKIYDNFASTSYEDILVMQEMLRRQIRRQLIQANVTYIIKNRRVQNKEQFQVFLNNFMKGLQVGQLNIRISKTIKRS